MLNSRQCMLCRMNSADHPRNMEMTAKFLRNLHADFTVHHSAQFENSCIRLLKSIVPLLEISISSL